MERFIFFLLFFLNVSRFPLRSNNRQSSKINLQYYSCWLCPVIELLKSVPLPILLLVKLPVRVLRIKVWGVDGEGGPIAVTDGRMYCPRRDEDHITWLHGMSLVPQLKRARSLDEVYDFIMFLLDMRHIPRRGLNHIDCTMLPFHQIDPFDRFVLQWIVPEDLIQVPDFWLCHDLSPFLVILIYSAYLF